MNIKCFSYKPTLIDDNGIEYVDLSFNTLKTNLYDSILGIYRVESSTEMRPDLICMKYYGTTDYMDILLKSNNIFNPFSIKEGDVLVIPAIKKEDDLYDTPVGIINDDLRKKYVDQSQLSEVDQNRINRIKNSTKKSVTLSSDQYNKMQKLIELQSRTIEDLKVNNAITREILHSILLEENNFKSKEEKDKINLVRNLLEKNQMFQIFN